MANVGPVASVGPADAVVLRDSCGSLANVGPLLPADSGVVFASASKVGPGTPVLRPAVIFWFNAFASGEVDGPVVTAAFEVMLGDGVDDVSKVLPVDGSFGPTVAEDPENSSALLLVVIFAKVGPVIEGPKLFVTGALDNVGPVAVIGRGLVVLYTKVGPRGFGAT